MTITTIPQEVLEAIENHPRAEEKFIGTFENSQEIIKYFPDWWEEKCIMTNGQNQKVLNN